MSREARTCTMGEMTFGDTIKSSFCIKHKLLIQFKKIIFCFLLRLGRKEGGWGGGEDACLFNTGPRDPPRARPRPWGRPPGWSPFPRSAERTPWRQKPASPVSLFARGKAGGHFPSTASPRPTSAPADPRRWMYASQRKGLAGTGPQGGGLSGEPRSPISSQQRWGSRKGRRMTLSAAWGRGKPGITEGRCCHKYN